MNRATLMNRAHLDLSTDMFLFPNIAVYLVYCKYKDDKL